jgi:hypothetical protein
MSLALIGTVGDPRVAGFQAARARRGLPAAPLADYRMLIDRPAAAAVVLKNSAVARVESPGRDPQVLAGLLRAGIIS